MGSVDILGQDYGRLQNTQHPFGSNNNSFTSAKPSQGFDSAFAGMALEHAPSQGAELPPPSGFEERVNMLSTGSAGERLVS